MVRQLPMPKNPLIKTNPYLKNTAERNAMLATSVATSSAIEGVHLHVIDDEKANWAVAVSPETSRKKAKKKSTVTCHEAESSYRSRR
jgi:hypothetical protein